MWQFGANIELIKSINKLGMNDKKKYLTVRVINAINCNEYNLLYQNQNFSLPEPVDNKLDQTATNV